MKSADHHPRWIGPAPPFLRDARLAPAASLARVEPGAPVPSVIVYDQDVKPVDIADLAQDGPYLLSFYLYDWTGT